MTNGNGRRASTPFKLKPVRGGTLWMRERLSAGIWIPRLLNARQRRQLLEGLVRPEGLEAACAAAGVSVGEALVERMRDRQFRRAWQAADSERLEAAATLVIDRIIGSLEKNAKGEGQADKVLLALWQDLRAERRKPLADARAPVRRGAAALAGRAGAAEAAEVPDAAAEAAEVQALVERVAGRIAEAEAMLGLSGVRPAAGG